MMTHMTIVSDEMGAFEFGRQKQECPLRQIEEIYVIVD